MTALSEADLYGQLLAEACTPLLQRQQNVDCVTITPDGGRYSKSRSQQLSKKLTTDFNNAPVRGPKVIVGFESSHMLAGLQIADVVANSVFQSLSGSSYKTKTAKRLVEPLQASGKLKICSVELKKICPVWLTTSLEVEKPP